MTHSSSIYKSVPFGYLVRVFCTRLMSVDMEMVGIDLDRTYKTQHKRTQKQNKNDAQVVNHQRGTFLHSSKVDVLAIQIY
jgi:hypothetical protein